LDATELLPARMRHVPSEAIPFIPQQLLARPTPILLVAYFCPIGDAARRLFVGLARASPGACKAVTSSTKIDCKCCTPVGDKFRRSTNRLHASSSLALSTLRKRSSRSSLRMILRENFRSMMHSMTLRALFDRPAGDRLRLLRMRSSATDVSAALRIRGQASLLMFFVMQTLMRCGGGPCSQECAMLPSIMPLHQT